MITFEVSNKIKKLFNEVIADMEQAGVPNDIANVVKVELMNKKKTRGTCKRVRKDISKPAYTIRISQHLSDEWDIKSVIAHEMIHTAIFDDGHSNRFFYYIDKMHTYNSKYLRLYGGKGKQSHKSDNLNCVINYKYTVTCKCCGNENHYSRWSKIMSDCSHFRCLKCNTLGQFKTTQNY